MSKPPLPLTALSEAQRAQAQERFEIIRLVDAVSFIEGLALQTPPRSQEVVETARQNLIIGPG